MPVLASEPIQVRLRRIQTALGVTADGVLGPETLSALEAKLDIAPKSTTWSLECSRRSLDEIVRFEVSSASFYERTLQRPTWPGEHSGVTIGIGYDLGVTSRKQAVADWEPHLNDSDLNLLLVAQGVTGESASQLAKSLSSIVIPFSTACTVFYQSTLPLFARRTRDTYPGTQSLPADAQGMLLSLIYNRGIRLSGTSRTEMAAIKPLVHGGVANLSEIAEQIESMTRLWPKSKGLRARRLREAAIIREADRKYDPEELVRV
jgi:peptidoglycan hydrolase-like protein with peptidoglycan-binding domain